MKNAYGRFLDPGLLVLSGLLLSSLVPGGPIETRDFSHISVPVLLGFNLFLTTLVLGSFLAGVGLWFGSPRARTASFWAAASYVLVYAIDVAGWFPSSPTPMPPALVAVETIGLTIALPLLWRLANARSLHSGIPSRKVFSGPGLAVLVLIGIAIVVFATRHAMGSGKTISLFLV